jgi:hypothetical protein
VKWIALREGMQDDTMHHYQQLLLSFIPQMISHPFLTPIRRYIDIGLIRLAQSFLLLRFFGSAWFYFFFFAVSFRLDFGGLALALALAFTWILWRTGRMMDKEHDYGMGLLLFSTLEYYLCAVLAEGGLVDGTGFGNETTLDVYE